jgi:hypothetical protein
MIEYRAISVEEQEKRLIRGTGVGFMVDDGSIIDESVYVYEYNDLYVSKKENMPREGSVDINISQPCVLINIHDVQYFHFINDGIASFLLISNMIPDLKVVLVSDQFADIDMSNFLDMVPQDYARTIFGWLNDEGLIHDVVALKKYNHVLFDKVFVLSSGYEKEYFVGKNYSDFDFYFTQPRGNISLPQSRLYFTISAPFIREYVTSRATQYNRLPDDFDYPKKIFLSPGETMSRYWSWEKQIKFLIDDGVIIDEDGVIQSDPNGSFYKLASTKNDKDTIYQSQWGEFDKNVIRGKAEQINHRSISKKDFAKLEAFFAEQGYLVIDSRNYAWIDVVNMSMRAENLVVYAGAASVYAMMAGSSARILYINPNTKYHFSHVTLLDTFFNNPKVIQVFDVEDARNRNVNFGVDRLIQELVDNHMDRI